MIFPNSFHPCIATRSKKNLIIPEIIAKKAIRKPSVPEWRFRNAWVYATEGGLFFRDKNIHRRKNLHECGGALPAWLTVLEKGDIN